YDVGLKPILGGSIPSFLSLLLRKQVLQMYGMEEDIREVIPGLLWLVQLTQLLDLMLGPLK
ncbi:hypothetical protein NL478_26180, partial [Klebsiella pneumoniae]|nr:hypothetical protein [Klebsiella pneumoniae]